MDKLATTVLSFFSLFAGTAASLARSDAPQIDTAGLRKGRKVEQNHTADKLVRITVPLMQFKETPMNVALKWLTDECQRLDQEGAGVNVMITPRAAVSD